jgi:general stress protein YciG
MAGNKNSGRKKKDTSKAKGRGWHGDPERHRMAGSLGGQATLEEMGTEFYSQIGRQGGSMSPGNFKNDPKRASIAGRKGGKSRKKTDEDFDDADMIDQAA